MRTTTQRLVRRTAGDHGWVWWRSVTTDSELMLPSMRLAMRDTVPAVFNASAWRVLAPGFDVVEQPVLMGAAE